MRGRICRPLSGQLCDSGKAGRPGSKECADGMGTTIKVREEIGTPVAPEKYQPCVWRF